ncbi:MAG TPA: pilin assembly protein [Steroidobacteraceae bacterium]|nr:pilin assembly protein [Steroidobacteraceae bacterium]
MTFKQLLDTWSAEARPAKTAREYSVRLPLDAAAKLHALAELFPGHTAEDLLTDLLTAAMRELETAMPYRAGARVISHDEQGDPVYEDVGPTPRFLELTKRYKQELAGEVRSGGRASE